MWSVCVSVRLCSGENDNMRPARLQDVLVPMQGLAATYLKGNPMASACHCMYGAYLFLRAVYFFPVVGSPSGSVARSCTPCSPQVRAISNYRKTVIVSMPRLRYLDDRPIFKLERSTPRGWPPWGCSGYELRGRAHSAAGAAEAWSVGGAPAEKATREVRARHARTAAFLRHRARSHWCRRRRRKNAPRCQTT